MSTITGTCNCGSISLTIPTPQSDNTILCHCTSCRAMSGSVFGVAIIVPTTNVVLKGDPKDFTETKTTSGVPVIRSFCGTCGCGIYSTSTADASTKYVKGGLFEPSAIPRPSAALFCKNAPEWEIHCEGMAQLEGMPPKQ